MNRPARTPFIAYLALALGITGAAAADFRTWSVYGGDPGGTRFSGLDQIDRSNVAQLRPAWIYRCGDRGSTIECNPIVVDGTLYLTTPGLQVVALDAAEGVPRWTFSGGAAGGVNRGVVWWSDGNDRRIFFASGTWLHAIDADTGEPVPSFGQDGRIDLREGLDRDVFFLHVTSSSPGIVYRDLLIMGSAVGEGPGPTAPGHIRAFDARTGERRWIFRTIPHPGEPGYDTWPPHAWKTAGGCNAWGGFTLDADRGIVFCGTGSPSYDHYGGDRPGANLYGNCVLALNAATGERIWHFQTVHHDLWDYDVPCPPVLMSVEREGRRIDAVAQVTKTGMVFLLDRETGDPLFPVEERPVPPSTIPGESSWPTQPFPVRPPPYAQQRFTAQEASDLTPDSREAILQRLTEMTTGDIFLPPGFRDTVTLPQFNGGTDWGGPAADPRSGILYVNCSNEAEWISMVPAKPERNLTLGQLGQRLYGAICSNCHGFNVAPAAPGAAETPGAVAPSLRDVATRLSPGDLDTLLAEGRGQMPPFPALSEVEKDALTAFLFDRDRDRRVELGENDLAWARATPYLATGHHDFRDPEGFPVNDQPWGALNAIDLNRGEILWQVPLGTYPELERRGLPPTGTFNMGGPLATAGGLVFIGASMDERFRAFHSETGEVLWEFQMDAGGYASPSSYEINGRQFVVIAAGGGGKPGTRRGDAYYAFALPD
ncbi:MAG TPA: PQQ-binding-like beta-propeller repeat protein [Verrucomicrobiales bacterium]|nr:PQQ-binding-like beta-propeller repeat protein [Verrucomicrobiales bacterium]